jgi:Ricin-type beta-trefoil lectin domain
MHVPRMMAGARPAPWLVGAVLSVAVLGAGVARADGPVQLRNGAGDFCLDHPDSSMLGPMVINPCNGSTSQRWNLLGNGQIQSAAFPEMCLAYHDGLSVFGGEQTIGMQPSFCAGGFGGNQYWTIQPDGLIRMGLSSCLAPIGDLNPGTHVSTRACNGGAPEQQWNIVP